MINCLTTDITMDISNAQMARPPAEMADFSIFSIHFLSESC